MPLQQLVEYFNDRLEQEHKNTSRAFTLQDGAAQALFGPLRIGSRLKPVRCVDALEITVGSYAQLTVNVSEEQLPPLLAENSPLAGDIGGNPPYQSVIDFDRLARTVHMLNFLPQAHLEELLFLDVDPRHILGVKSDHGAYFEEIIHKCGLHTGNIVIVLTVDQDYLRLYPILLKGLENYQRRGYRLALKFTAGSLDKTSQTFINRAAADFIGLQAPDHEQRGDEFEEQAQEFARFGLALGGQGVLFNANPTRHIELARRHGFQFVQYDEPKHDGQQHHDSQSEPVKKNPSPTRQINSAVYPAHAGGVTAKH